MLQHNCWWQSALNPAAKVSSPSFSLTYECTTSTMAVLALHTNCCNAAFAAMCCMWQEAGQMLTPSSHSRSRLLSHFLQKLSPLADVKCSNFFQDSPFHCKALVLVANGNALWPTHTPPVNSIRRQLPPSKTQAGNYWQHQRNL